MFNISPTWLSGEPGLNSSRPLGSDVRNLNWSDPERGAFQGGRIWGQLGGWEGLKRVYDKPRPLGSGDEATRRSCKALW